MARHNAYNVPIMGGALALGPAPLIMGILNMTPDSFSDGGAHNDLDSALTHTRLMLEQGAAIIDIGGQSTRPGADEVSTKDELARTIPVIEHLVASGIKAPISIDTFKAEVAAKAIAAGAQIINDVTGAQRDPEIADVAARHKTPLILMHWDKDRNQDADIIDEMKRFFATSIAIAQKYGVAMDSLILDPGFGFAKSLQENYTLLARIEEFNEMGYPLLIGTSRKSMLGNLLNLPTDARANATAATSVIAYQQGAHIFRVHDIKPNNEALQMPMPPITVPPACEHKEINS